MNDPRQAQARAIMARIGELYRSGREADAEAEAERLKTHAAPGDAGLRQTLAVTALRNEAPAAALCHIDEGLALRPGEPAFLLLRGAALRRLGRHTDAAEALTRAAMNAPGREDVAMGAARELLELGRARDARGVLERLAVEPGRDLPVRLLYARALAESGSPADAESIYQGILAEDPGHESALHAYISLMWCQCRFEEAEKLLRDACANFPHKNSLKGQLADVLLKRAKHAEACDLYRELAGVYPNNFAVRVAFFRALARSGDFDAARRELAAARSINRDQVRRLFEGMAGATDRYAPADRIFSEPTPEYFFAGHLMDQLKYCDWSEAQEALAKLAGISETADVLVDSTGSPLLPPYLTLLLSFDESFQHRTATAWSQWTAREADKLGLRHLPVPVVVPAAGRRLRIGYLSADFRTHAVTALLKAGFRHFDHDRFEVFGYAVNPDDGSDDRRIIEAGCDVFRDLTGWSNRDLARKIRDDGIDILVDLSGWTAGERQVALLQRPAPIQVHWIGFQGSLGADWIDYHIGTPILNPPESEPFYTEKIARLPDAWLPLSGYDEGLPTTRAAHGLPEDAFVYCCFQRGDKIDPDLFTTWMNILKRVPDSVLWLLGTVPEVEANLAREAEARGIDPRSRIVFAKNCILRDHVARQRLADLFLNTTAYSGTTTVSTALWACLPVLAGRGFNAVTRTGAAPSILCGMPELVADDLAGYEERAVELGREPEKAHALRRHLEETRATSVFFDAPRMVRHLERAYEMMWARHEAGLPPETFDVPVQS